MHVKIYGPGCAKCEEAERLMKETAAKLKSDAHIEKISDLATMMKAGIMSTPAVSIDDVVKCTGRVPTAYEAAAWLTGKDVPAAAGGEGCCCGGKC